MITGAQEVGFLLQQRQISLTAIRALLSIMVTYNTELLVKFHQKRLGENFAFLQFFDTHTFSHCVESLN